MNNSVKQLSFLGALVCGLAVVIGAFGGHGVEKYFDQSAKDTFEVGVRYQFYHGLALLFLAWLEDKGIKVYRVGLLFILAILLFSGGLYLYVLTGIRSFAFVTPFGGMLFIFSWFFLMYKINLKKY